MFGKYFCFTAILAFMLFLPGANALSGESASIKATASVLPAIGFETGTQNNPENDMPPEWLMRLPDYGSVICRIETTNSTKNYYYYSADKNRQITLPDITSQNSVDSCIITLIYSEN
jgi:hypothetical protein